MGVKYDSWEKGRKTGIRFGTRKKGTGLFLRKRHKRRRPCCCNVQLCVRDKNDGAAVVENTGNKTSCSCHHPSWSGSCDCFLLLLLLLCCCLFLCCADNDIVCWCLKVYASSSPSQRSVASKCLKNRMSFHAPVAFTSSPLNLLFLPSYTLSSSYLRALARLIHFAHELIGALPKLLGVQHIYYIAGFSAHAVAFKGAH